MHLASLAVATALLHVACAVQVDGAPCSVPGKTVDCPADQACGNDLRCSARALACAGSMCTPDATYCSSTRTALAMRCDRVDPVCGKWLEDDCGARGMECGTRGSGACECPEPENLVTFVVADPRGSPSRSVVPFPRGQANPRECSFGRLADALLAVSTGVASTVAIAGDPGVPAVFGTATAEPWPLVVPFNVTLRGAQAPVADSVIRAGPEPSAAGTILRVLGSVAGVRIDGGGARGAGIELGCGTGPGPSLEDVVVDGGGSVDPTGAVTAGLRAGVSILAASCGSRLERVAVTGVAGPAFDVEASASTQVVGGSFSGSEVGMWLRGGRTTVSPDGTSRVRVSGNAGLGIVIGGGADLMAPHATVPQAVIDRADVTLNGGLGVLVSRLAEAGSSVTLTRCDVSGNGRMRPFMSGGGDPRQVGGVVLSLGSQATLAAFAGNRLWSNAGDQLVIESDANWVIGPSACGADTNQFTCVSLGAWALRIFGFGSVSAQNDRWPGTSDDPFFGFIGPNVTVPKVPTVLTYKVCAGPLFPGEPALPACLP